MSLLVSRWESLSEQLVSEVSLENVWISPRTVSRGRDRADQTTGSTDKGSKAAGQHAFLSPYHKNLQNCLSNRVLKYVSVCYRQEKHNVLKSEKEKNVLCYSMFKMYLLNFRKFFFQKTQRLRVIMEQPSPE